MFCNVRLEKPGECPKSDDEYVSVDAAPTPGECPESDDEYMSVDAAPTPGECPKFPWCGIPDDEQEALKAYVRGDNYPVPDRTDPRWEWDEMYNEMRSRQCAPQERHWGNEYALLYRGHALAGRPTPDIGNWVMIRSTEKSAKAVDLKWKQYEDIYRLPREAGWLIASFLDWEVQRHFQGTGENFPAL